MYLIYGRVLDMKVHFQVNTKVETGVVMFSKYPKPTRSIIVKVQRNNLIDNELSMETLHLPFGLVDTNFRSLLS